MKKFILLGLAIALIVPTISAQKKNWADEETIVTGERIVKLGNTANQEVKGVHPYKDFDTISHDWNHWSVYADFGFSFFDGDFNWKNIKSPLRFPALSAGVMYNFSSTWGVGFQYGYERYGVTGNNGVTAADNNMLSARVHRIGGFLNVDIFNAFMPWSRHKLFDLSIIAGGGSSWFTRDIYYNRFEYRDYDAEHPDKSQTDNGKFQNVGFLNGGVDFQFNVHRQISLGMKLMYYFYLNDVVDGRRMGNNNDGTVDIALSLRYKINSENESHELNAIRRRKPDQATLDYIDMQAAQQVASFGAGLGKDTIITMPDTNIINNLVLAGAQQAVTQQQAALAADPYYYIYFDNDKAVLRDDGLYTIHQAAEAIYRAQEKMDSIFVVVVGHCDNTGTIAHNDGLAKRRAKRTADELREEYGIVVDTVAEIGQNIAYGRRSKASYSPNRRVDILLLNREDYNEFLAEQRKWAEQQEELIKSIQAMQKLQKANGRTITMPKDMTLARLAQQEYGNAHCWIYIFEVNQDQISSPDKVQDGMVLVLPELTDEQKTINRPQAAERMKELTDPEYKQKKEEAKNAAKVEVKPVVAPAPVQQEPLIVAAPVPVKAQPQVEVAPAAPAAQPQVQAASAATQPQVQAAPAPEKKKAEILATEVTRKDWTLAKMARKYYGNANCWVFIYQQNRFAIPDPANVKEGLKVMIPALTAEQKAITKDEAAALEKSIVESASKRKAGAQK